MPPVGKTIQQLLRSFSSTVYFPSTVCCACPKDASAAASINIVISHRFQYHQCSYRAREKQLSNKPLNALTVWRHLCLTINVQMELMYLIWLFYQQVQRTTLCFMLLASLSSTRYCTKTFACSKSIESLSGKQNALPRADLVNVKLRGGLCIGRLKRCLRQCWKLKIMSLHTWLRDLTLKHSQIL